MDLVVVYIKIYQMNLILVRKVQWGFEIFSEKRLMMHGTQCAPHVDLQNYLKHFSMW